MTRLTASIPATTADAVNAALVDLVGPEAAGTFSVTDPADDTRLVSSWDLSATGHEHLAADVAALVEKHGVAGSGRTARRAVIAVGDEPATARLTTAADLKG